MRKKKQLQYVAVALSAALVCGPVIPADAAGIQSAGSSRNTESVLSEDIPVAYAARGAAPELSVAEEAMTRPWNLPRLWWGRM